MRKFKLKKNIMRLALDSTRVSIMASVLNSVRNDIQKKLGKKEE